MLPPAIQPSSLARSAPPAAISSESGHQHYFHLTLEGAVTGGTSSIFIITRGNVVVNGNGVTGGASITSSHTSSAILVGRQSNTSTLNLTIENGGQLNSAFGVNMGSGTAGSDDASMNINVFGSGPTAISSIQRRWTIQPE